MFPYQGSKPVIKALNDGDDDNDDDDDDNDDDSTNKMLFSCIYIIWTNFRLIAGSWTHKTILVTLLVENFNVVHYKSYLFNHRRRGGARCLCQITTSKTVGSSGKPPNAN
jgi:hypothetical protein